MKAKPKEQLIKKIAEIKEYLLSNTFENSRLNSPALLSGMSGLVQVMSILYLYFPEQRLKKKIEKTLYYTLSLVDGSDFLLSNFCNGLAGLGWMLHFMEETKKHTEIDIAAFVDVNSFLSEVDERLAESLTSMLKENDFDLLHGAMGIALYFLKRGKRQKEIVSVVLAIDKAKNVYGNEFIWERYDKYQTKRNLYDFGLAHGNASIMYFLGKCYKNGIKKNMCKQLINGSVNFYLNNIQTDKNVISFFPYYVVKEEYISGENKPIYSRLGWCYGDLGILHTLLLVGKWIQNSTLCKVATEMLANTTLRKTLDETTLVDSQFCHGMSGVGYMFLSIYSLTQKDIFREAADFWFAKILKDGSDSSRGSCGYLFEMGENVGWVEMYDLLSGIGGLTLSLLAYSNNKKMENWDECFFLS